MKNKPNYYAILISDDNKEAEIIPVSSIATDTVERILSAADGRELWRASYLPAGEASFGSSVYRLYKQYKFEQSPSTMRISTDAERA